MTEKQPIRTTVRSTVVIILVLVAASSSLLPSSSKEKFWEEMDVTALLDVVKQRGAQVPDDECEILVRQNLKHIYFNALQTDQFLGMPKPDRVADQACAVFRMSEELRLLVEQARALTRDETRADRLGKMARKIGDRAGSLHRRFREYFREENLTDCGVALDLRQPVPARFSSYVERCEELRRALDSQIDHYFLNPSPGIIELSAYRTCSISELSLSLRELSDSFEKSLSTR